MIRAAVVSALLLAARMAQGGPEQFRLDRRLPGMETDLPSAHYAGLIDVDASEFDFPWPGSSPAVRTFFWLAERERRATSQDAGPETEEEVPLILWIQGGPGGSSLVGGFTELGPLSLDDRSRATRTYAKTGVPSPLVNPQGWTKFAHLLFAEYADIGFSRCRAAAGGSGRCTWDDASVSHALYQLLLRLLQDDMFPHLRRCPLWIAGESYAGILVTTLAAVIDFSNGRAGGHRQLALRGVLHGNGAVGHHGGGPDEWWPEGFNTRDVPDDARHHVEFFYRAGLTSERLHAETLLACPDFERPSRECQDAMRRMAASIGDFTKVGEQQWDVYDIYDTCSDMPHGSRTRGRLLRGLALTLQRAGREDAGYGRWSSTSGADAAEWSASWACGGRGATEDYFNNLEVRKAIHLPLDRYAGYRWQAETDLNYTCSNDDEASARRNFSNCPMVDFRPLIKDLASKGYAWLVYSGDSDAQLPHTATEAWTSGMGFRVRRDWQPWTLNGFVQGYVTEYDHNFTYATVKGAGHMVPMFRPRAALALASRFVLARGVLAGGGAEVYV